MGYGLGEEVSRTFLAPRNQYFCTLQMDKHTFLRDEPVYDASCMRIVIIYGVALVQIRDQDLFYGYRFVTCCLLALLTFGRGGDSDL